MDRPALLKGEITPNLVAQHDLIAFNPPQLPESIVSHDYLAQVLANESEMLFRIGEQGSNPDGVGVVREFLRWLADLKQPKPTAVVTQSSLLGKNLILEAIQSCRLSAAILNRTRVPLRKALNGAAIKIFGDEPQRVERSLRAVS